MFSEWQLPLLTDVSALWIFQAVWLLSSRYWTSNTPSQTPSLPLLLTTSRMFLTGKLVTFPESPSSWWVKKCSRYAWFPGHVAVVVLKVFSTGLCTGMLSAWEASGGLMQGLTSPSLQKIHVWIVLLDWNPASTRFLLAVSLVYSIGLFLITILLVRITHF